MKRALGERYHYYILNILSDNWQNDGFRQLKAEMAHTPIQFVIHLNLASTCDEIEGKGTSVHRLKHCHFNQVMRTLKSCNDKETCTCAVLSEFLFRLFCRSCRHYGCTELSSRITTQKYSWYASTLPKNQRFCGKRKAEIEVHKYPSTEAQIYFPATLKKRRYLMEIIL